MSSHGGDEVSGRGWVVLEATDRLTGIFFFHMGEESASVAKRLPCEDTRDGQL